MASAHDVSGLLSPLALQICNMLNAPADEYFTFQVTLPSSRPHLSVLRKRGAALPPSLHTISLLSRVGSRLRDKKTHQQFWSIWKISLNAKLMVQIITAFGILKKKIFIWVKKVREGCMWEMRLTWGLKGWPTKLTRGWRMNNVMLSAWLPLLCYLLCRCHIMVPWFSDFGGHQKYPIIYSRCMPRGYETSKKKKK